MYSSLIQISEFPIEKRIDENSINLETTSSWIDGISGVKPDRIGILENVLCKDNIFTLIDENTIRYNGGIENLDWDYESAYFYIGNADKNEDDVMWFNEFVEFIEDVEPNSILYIGTIFRVHY